MQTSLLSRKSRIVCSFFSRALTSCYVDYRSSFFLLFLPFLNTNCFYFATSSGTASPSMRYHVGRLCGLLDGADRKDSDAHQENPQRTSCQDLCHALCIRLEVSLVFIFYFSILICFLTQQSSDSVTLTRAHISVSARAHCHIWSD